MHRLSTFRAVGQSGFGARKTGGSARGSPKGGAGNLSALGQSNIQADGGSEIKGLAEQMFGGGGDDESTTSIVRVGEGSSTGPRSLRGSIAGRGSIRSGASSGAGVSSLRNKLSKGL